MVFLLENQQDARLSGPLVVKGLYIKVVGFVLLYLRMASILYFSLKNRIN